MRFDKMKDTNQGQCSAPGKVLYQVVLTILVFGVFFGLFSTLFGLVYAQDASNLIIQPPDLTNFPVLTVNFKIPTSSDQAIGGLKIKQLSLYEDDQISAVESLEQRLQGVYFTLVINGDRAFDLRDENGISLYDKLRTVLVDWVKSKPSGETDTWSLAANEGFEIQNSASSEEWMDALEAYQPDFRNMAPGLQGLESAIRKAGTRVALFGVDKSLLYITAPPTPEQIEPIKVLTEEARSADIQVNVWMIGEAFFLNNDQGGALMDLAANTNGQFFHLVDPENIPNPAEYLTHLGHFYTLTYQSNLRESGTYPLRIEVMLPDGLISGHSQPFYIDIRPPQPIFISPPSSVTRQSRSETDIPLDKGQSLDNLEPSSMDFNIIIEFPDGRPREILASRLLVDGKLMDERLEEPLTTLTWELKDVVETGEHTIQVEIEDSLGLSARTILTPLRVDVLLPEPESPPSLGGIIWIIVGLLFTIATLLVVVWLMGRFWRSKRLKDFWEKILSSKKSSVITPIVEDGDSGTIFANLTSLHSANGDGKVISITRRLTSFGCDSENADVVVDAADVEGLHAELRCIEGIFWLRDLGSAKGTWVNYAEVGVKPIEIKPGDLIHFGNSGFRFTINGSAPPREVNLSKYKPIL